MGKKDKDTKNIIKLIQELGLNRSIAKDHYRIGKQYPTNNNAENYVGVETKVQRKLITTETKEQLYIRQGK